MKSLKQISLEWWIKANIMSADRNSFETGYNTANQWTPIEELEPVEKALIINRKDYILKTPAGRVFRGHIDSTGTVWEFEGFEIDGIGTAYKGVTEEGVESFKTLN